MFLRAQIFFPPQRAWVWFPAPHGSSHVDHDITTVSGDLTASSDLCKYQAYVWYTYIHVGTTLMHKQALECTCVFMPQRESGSQGNL